MSGLLFMKKLVFYILVVYTYNKVKRRDGNGEQIIDKSYQKV